MGRIRSIKPEFPQSESMGRVSRDARLLFIQLWTLVDDSGRTRAASRVLASLLYPYDEDAMSLIDGWLGELEREKCIRRYMVDNRSYLEICKWLSHQKIDRPSKPIHPEPPLDNREGSRGLDEGSSLEGKGREGNREELNPPTPLATREGSRVTIESSVSDAEGDGRASPWEAPSRAAPTPLSADTLGNPEVYAMATMIAIATPYATLRSLRPEDVTASQRVAVISAAKAEAKSQGVSTGEALEALLRAVEHQVAHLTPERLQFQGTVETYMKNHTYRVDANHLTGAGNGKSKGERTTDAARAVIADLRRERGSGAMENGATERRAAIEGKIAPLRRRLM